MHSCEVILSAYSLIEFSVYHSVVLVVELIKMLRKVASYAFFGFFFFLMALLLSILCWSLLESLGRSVGPDR